MNSQVLITTIVRSGGDFEASTTLVSFSSREEAERVIQNLQRGSGTFISYYCKRLY